MNNRLNARLTLTKILSRLQATAEQPSVYRKQAEPSEEYHGLEMLQEGEQKVSYFQF